MGAERVESPELTLEYQRSTTMMPKQCICCPGEPGHVFAYLAREKGAVGRYGYEAFVHEAMRAMPDGQRFRVVIELIEDTPSLDTAVCQRCDWEGPAGEVQTLCPACGRESLMFFAKV